MNAPLDVSAILASAGANADAPMGTNAWYLAQVDKAVRRLHYAAALTDHALREAWADGTLPAAVIEGDLARGLSSAVFAIKTGPADE